MLFIAHLWKLKKVEIRGFKSTPPPSSVQVTSQASFCASESTLYVFLCFFHMAFIHFTSQKHVCFHFKHRLFTALPQRSHGTHFDIRVLTALLVPAFI